MTLSWRPPISGLFPLSIKNPFVLLFAIALFLPILAGAAPAALPSAGQVLDRYVQVTGGASAWHAIRVKRDDIEGRTLDDQRVVLRATVTVSRAGNSLSRIHVPQEASEGVWKGTAWASSYFSGVRLKHGMEREEAMLDSRMLEEADWRKLYPKSHVAGVETIKGQLCNKVLLLPSLTEKTEWFSVATGLLVQQSAYELSSAGETLAGYTVEDWGKWDGIRQPKVMQAWRGDFRYRLRVLNSFSGNEREISLEYPPDVAEYVAAERAGKALPNAEEIVERHIFESGGPDIYQMLRTQKVTGTLRYLSRNIEARMETWAAGGGKYYQATDIPGMGKQEEGSDGIIAWDRSPSLGPRIKGKRSPSSAGVTLDAAGMIGWRFLIDRLRTEAQERVDDKDCYRVRLTPRDGSQDMLRWYDRATGLLYRSSLAVSTDMGALPLIMTFEEYRTIGEFKWPSRVRVSASGQDTLFIADEVKLNEPVEDAVFAVPPEIKELAAKKAKAIPDLP